MPSVNLYLPFTGTSVKYDSWSEAIAAAVMHGLNRYSEIWAGYNGFEEDGTGCKFEVRTADPERKILLASIMPTEVIT